MRGVLTFAAGRVDGEVRVYHSLLRAVVADSQLEEGDG